MQAPIHRPPILIISSHVADNSVGGRLTAFALERLGFPVWLVPSISLARHPKRGAGEAIRPDIRHFQDHLNRLVAAHQETPLAGIVTGYLGDPDQVPIIADTIRTLKETAPDLTYLCDPVLGDGSALYVAEPLAEAIRQDLFPLADMATPNLFETGWLLGTDAPLADAKAVMAHVSKAQTLPSSLVVTSVPGMMQGQIGNLLWRNNTVPLLFEHPAMPRALNGTGDLLAGLLLGQYLALQDLETACQKASASLFELTARAAKEGLDDLPIITEQLALERPVAMVHKRQIAAAISPALRTTSGKKPRSVFKPKAL